MRYYKCGTSIERVEEIRSLIQSESKWVMPLSKAFPRRSGQALQSLTDRSQPTSLVGRKSVAAAATVDCVQSTGLVLAPSRFLYPEVC